MNKSNQDARAKAADALDAAIWISQVWPKQRFSKWIMRNLLFPRTALSHFEKSMQTLLSLPTDERDALLKKIRNPDDNTAYTKDQYIAAIDAEAVRRGYMPQGHSLTSLSGPEPWLQAWHENPSLTPQEQVDAEIQAAYETL